MKTTARFDEKNKLCMSDAMPSYQALGQSGKIGANP
jgi:hypothetical protein